MESVSASGSALETDLASVLRKVMVVDSVWDSLMANLSEMPRSRRYTCSLIARVASEDSEARQSKP
jgi:hypothetical protein